MNYNQHDQSMYDYYSNRAPIYDKGFHFDHPQFGTDLKEMAAVVTETLEGRHVLEVACGTGIWTAVAAASAASLTGSDATPATLAEAKQKFTNTPNVNLVQADAYKLQSVAGRFDGGLAVQWFSHVPRKRYDEFFASFHGKLERGARVFMADSAIDAAWMPGGLFCMLSEPDTYQTRKLPDGSKYEIIKNVFTLDELKSIFAPRVQDLQIGSNNTFWWVIYKTA